jgi:hypothetical protein
MFSPSRDDVRQMFFGAWRKYRQAVPLVGIEAAALDVILQHPEYHGLLEEPQRYLERDYTDESNPFLHMSLHLALEEQLSIDQPPGIRALMKALEQKLGSAHDAAHQAQECLAETLWLSQRTGQPPDQQAYLDCLRKRAGVRPATS